MWFGADRTLLKVAEKGRTLAELTAVDAAIFNPSTSSGRTDQEATDAVSALGLETLGKVFINATSGFANVRVGVWQHTIGGYQVLHKWLDDRRKAGRSLSDEDITHWLRVYAALEATQGLMQQVDETINAHGGWPDGAGNGGAFSLDHPPPDAATIAAEQATVAAQLKAGKKHAKQAATAATTGTAPGGIGGTMSLFDPESDLDELATASARGQVGAGPENTAASPKGAEASASTRRIEDIDDWDMMCAVRAVLARDGALSRDDLIRDTAHELGFGRTGSRIADALDDGIRRAVRRGIAINQGGELSLVSRTIEGYDRGFLKQLLVTCIGTAWQDKAELPTRFARTLGFARTGAVIEETVWSLVASLLRSGEIETDGRADERRYRRKKA